MSETARRIAGIEARGNEARRGWKIQCVPVDDYSMSNTVNNRLQGVYVPESSLTHETAQVLTQDSPTNGGMPSPARFDLIRSASHLISLLASAPSSHPRVGVATTS